MNNNSEQHMNASEQEGNIQKNILESIRSESLTMRPKFYFTLSVVALIVIAFLVLIISVFILSFILFFVRASSEAHLLGFGSRGFIAFLVFFPWKTLLVDILLIMLLELLVRRFRFGYKRPAGYLLLAIVAILLSSAIFLEYNRFQDRLFDRSDHLQVPVFGEMYEHARRLPSHENGMCRCVVTAINGNVLTVLDDNIFGTTTTLQIVLPQEIGTSSIKVGDRIFVAGDIEDGSIHAYGVSQLDPTNR